MNDYHPIACHQHDLYEAAIVSRQLLRLEWLHNGQSHQATVRPLDLRTTDGAEWLFAEQHDGLPLRLRLDWISRAETLQT